MGEENDTLKNIILFIVYVPTTILGLVLVYLIATGIMKWANTGQPPEIVNYIVFYIKEIITFLTKPIMYVLKFLNYIIPVPWRENGSWVLKGGEAWSERMRFISLMIVLLTIYSVVSIMFILDATPVSLKVYSDVISYSLIIGGILLALGCFVLYLGKTSGKLISKGIFSDGQWVLSESKPYLFKAILSGLVLGVLSLLTHYFFVDSLTSVNLMYITVFLSMAGLMFFIYSMLSENKVFQRFLKNNLLFSLVYNLIFILPCIFFETAKFLYLEFKHTPGFVYGVLGIELIVVFMYIILPMLKNHIYTIMPGKDDTLSAIEEAIKISEDEIKALKAENNKIKSYKPKNGFALNDKMWEKFKKHTYDTDEKIENALIRYGYKDSKFCDTVDERQLSKSDCLQPLHDMRDYVKNNLKTILINDMRIKTIKTQLKDIKKDRNNFTNYDNAIIIQNKPVYINKETVPQNNNLIHNNINMNLNYTLSAWFFLNHKTGEHGYKYDTYATILNYNMKPKVSFNNSNGKLKIEMNSGGDKDKISVAQYITDVPLQRWNNLVVNYDGGVVDIFINGELKKSLKNILPTVSYDSITLGETNGISGGVCNVVYYPSRISYDRILMNYNLLKNNNPPTI